MISRRSFFGWFPAAAVASVAVVESAPPAAVPQAQPEPPPQITPFAFFYMRALEDVAEGQLLVCVSGMTARRARRFERPSGLALDSGKAGEMVRVQVGSEDGPVRQTAPWRV